MKIRHWFFLVGVLLFVAGIGFTIAGARAARLAPVVEAPITTPVATVKQIMKGIVTPAAMVVFNSVSTTVSIQRHRGEVAAHRRGVGGGGQQRRGADRVGEPARSWAAAPSTRTNG